MGYWCDATCWMWLIAEIHFKMESVNWLSKSQCGTQAQTISVGLPWEGTLLLPITFHVHGEECIYKNSMVNYSSTTSSLHMYLSISLQADKGSSTICPSGGGKDNADRAENHGESVGSNQIASLAEGEMSCAILLDFLYPACTSLISLTIQPPNLTDTDGLTHSRIPGSPGSSMANFVDPSTGVTCCQSVEVQPLGGDVNPGNYYLEDPLVTAAAYGNNMQNSVRGCEHEAMSPAMNLIINIFTTKKTVVDRGSDDSIFDTSQNDMLLGGRLYPMSTEGVVTNGSCQTICHDQNEQRMCYYASRDYFVYKTLGLPQHTANQGMGLAPMNGASDVSCDILDCSGAITYVLEYMLDQMTIRPVHAKHLKKRWSKWLT